MVLETVQAAGIALSMVLSACYNDGTSSWYCTSMVLSACYNDGIGSLSDKVNKWINK